MIRTIRSYSRAILFAITACGYRVRCALEEDDSGDIRFDKLCRLIAESPRSIHDLSRTELGDNKLPRFNMPFELGLTLGAKQFGNEQFRAKRILILVRDPHKLPADLSDLGGNDPKAHHDDMAKLMGMLWRYVGARAGEAPLPGQKNLVDRLNQFRRELPSLAAELHLGEPEIDVFENYRDYIWFLAEFLKANPAL